VIHPIQTDQDNRKPNKVNVYFIITHQSFRHSSGILPDRPGDQEMRLFERVRFTREVFINDLEDKQRAEKHGHQEMLPNLKYVV